MSNWDERYARGEHATAEPSHLLKRALEVLAPKTKRAPQTPAPRALDLACGAGRHAVFLAEHGYEVTAVDASRVGIELARQRAAERGVKIDARAADLERGEFQIAPESNDLISVFYYLQRDLFPAIRAGVRRGGIIVAAIHLTDDTPDAAPMNSDFLLQPGELRAEFRDWEIIHYHETQLTDDDPGEHHRRTAELIAKKV